MEQELRNRLLKCAYAYASREGVTLPAVGLRAAGDRKFFDRIQSASFTIKIYDRVMNWFERNWPVDLDWPKDIPRTYITVRAE